MAIQHNNSNNHGVNGISPSKCARHIVSCIKLKLKRRKFFNIKSKDSDTFVLSRKCAQWKDFFSPWWIFSSQFIQLIFMLFPWSVVLYGHKKGGHKEETSAWIIWQLSVIQETSFSQRSVGFCHKFMSYVTNRHWEIALFHSLYYAIWKCFFANKKKTENHNKWIYCWYKLTWSNMYVHQGKCGWYFLQFM